MPSRATMLKKYNNNNNKSRNSYSFNYNNRIRLNKIIIKDSRNHNNYNRNFMKRKMNRTIINTNKDIREILRKFYKDNQGKTNLKNYFIKNKLSNIKDNKKKRLHKGTSRNNWNYNSKNNKDFIKPFKLNNKVRNMTKNIQNI